jgi:hypothetical protein
VLATLDFWVVAAEERPGVAQFEENPVGARRVTMPFAELGRESPAGEATFRWS